MSMIFLPLRPIQLEQLIADGRLDDLAGHTATAVLRREHGLGPDDDEDADYVAYGYAEGAAVALADRTGVGRTVIAVEIAAPSVTAVSQDVFGRASVAAVRWSEVTAVYLDEPDAVDPVSRVRAATVGMDVETALADASMISLLEDHDLLWHLPAEVAH